MTLSQLEAFVSVVQYGSIRAAARALGVEQSGLTQQIKRLETALGVTLLVRASKGIVLTAKGKELLTRARIILGECERVQQLFGDHGTELAGQVNVGISSEAFAKLVPPALSRLHANHPKISVHLGSGPSSLLIDGVREGRFDFAITLVSGGKEANDLKYMKIAPSEPCVLCRRGHPLQKSRHIKELSQATWVNTRPFDAVGTPSNRLADWFVINGLDRPKMIGSVESLYDTLDLIARTDYLFLGPSIVLVNPGYQNDLRGIQIVEPLPRADLCMVQRSAVPLAPVAQKLASMMLSYARILNRQYPIGTGWEIDMRG